MIFQRLSQRIRPLWSPLFNLRLLHFESVASSLKAAVEVENPVVVVRYLDNTGAEIVAQEFAG